MATSGYLFTLLKLAGAIYLIWLSSSLWTAPTEGKPLEDKVKTASLLKLFWKSLVIRILNPKGPAFYVAFVPQFVSSSGPIFLQFAILITPFVSVSILTSLFWLFLPVICERSFKSQLC
jgi:threonine/homoserine/homoserine lactone efflux protein